LFFYSKIRKNIIDFACLQGVKDCIEKSIKFFDEWVYTESMERIPSGMRSSVLCTAVKHGPEMNYKFLKLRFDQITDTQIRQDILFGLTCGKELTGLNKLIEKELEIGNYILIKNILITSSNDYKTSNFIVWTSVKNMWSTLIKYINICFKFYYFFKSLLVYCLFDKYYFPTYNWLEALN